ncbi:16ce20a4-d59a-4ef4-9f5d-28d34fe9a566 [Thermothielavioides terrestris]|uniref:16ce20a4-d59a-4ef4-9f5d-28d34fe9a566 n=1 Tax=Thermothielavioides terrestris TaxID=2587410 RepID=A0A3S4D6H8_9PEZI|nr:16ce20a4-d59a-4ef4-9f5d-28d34fe9a566 [Thermothielavioides terrestris]
MTKKRQTKAKAEAEATMPPTNDPRANGINDDDYVPAPHAGFHEDERLCKEMVARVASPFPLEIRPSSLCVGSGLFAAAEIDAGREIYHAVPDLAAVDPSNESFCDWCFEDTKLGVSNASSPKAGENVKLCSACKAARFCSKDCQKMAWSAYHKDECKVLKGAPAMKPQHLLAHRLFFWHKRGYSLGKAYGLLQTHFDAISKDPDRLNEVLDIAMAVQEATGKRARMDLVWMIVPALRVNCVRMRPAEKNESVGYAFEFLTAVINHSCDPNALVFFQGRELRVRSLKKIAPGEEITICYIDPTFDVAARQEVLKREYFFDCSCARCTSELAEQRALLGGSRDLGPLHQAQRQIRDLLRSAVRASKHPGIYPDLDDLPTVETRLRTITATASPWPDHLEPLPAARLSLALLYLDQGKPIPALRCALKGKFLSSRSRGGPEWVNEMMDVVKVLVVTGCLRPDEAAFEDKTFPELDDIRAVTYGYVYELCREASRAFGGDANYTKGICGMCTALMAKKAGPRPGTKEFREEFDAAQEKLLTWAGIEVAKGVVLS